MTKGSIIYFKAAGKCARLEGMAGKICQAKVTEIRDDIETLEIHGEVMIECLPTHRTISGADFFNMGALVPISSIIDCEYFKTKNCPDLNYDCVNCELPCIKKFGCLKAKPSLCKQCDFTGFCGRS